MKKFLIFVSAFAGGIFVGRKWPEIRKKYQELSKTDLKEELKDVKENVSSAVNDAVESAKEKVD